MCWCHLRRSSTGCVFPSLSSVLTSPLLTLDPPFLLSLNCSLSFFRSISRFRCSRSSCAIRTSSCPSIKSSARKERSSGLSPRRLLHFGPRSFQIFRVSEQLFDANVYRDELQKMEADVPSLIRVLLDAWFDEGKAFDHGSSEICICLNLMQNVPSEVLFLNLQCISSYPDNSLSFGPRRSS